jgi:drug/metabolite transporter (DMT)-like permease
VAKQDLGAPLAFATCCIVWGTTFLAIRESDATLAPLWGAALRLAIAGALLCVPWAILRQPIPRGKVLFVVIVFGVLDYGLNLGLLYWAEGSIPSGLAAVFYATAPISALLIARAIGQERLDGWKLAGTLVAFAGVATIFGVALTGAVNPWALLAVLGAATSASLSSVILRTIPPQPTTSTVAIGCLASAVFLVAGSALFREPMLVPTTWSVWWPVLYLAVAGSIVAFGLFTWLLGRWNASSATLVGIIAPVVAVGVGIVVGGERLTASIVLGGALVVAGVLVALLRARAVDRAARRPTTDA